MQVWFENIHYKAKDNEGVSKKDDKLVFSSEVGSKSDQNLEQVEGLIHHILDLQLCFCFYLGLILWNE